MGVGCTLDFGYIIDFGCGLHTSSSRAVSAVAELLVHKYNDQ